MHASVSEAKPRGPGWYKAIISPSSQPSRWGSPRELMHAQRVGRCCHARGLPSQRDDRQEVGMNWTVEHSCSMAKDTSGAVRDMPAPPGVDEIATRFGDPVLAFAPQPRLEEFASAQTMVLGRFVEISLSYSFFKNPLHHADPANQVPLTSDQQRAIERAENDHMPPWIADQVTRMRYPVIWEAVRTSVPIPAERSRPLESRLAAHMGDVLRNTFPGRVRSRRGGIPVVAAALRDEDVVRGVPIIVDGETVRGYRVNTDPDVVVMGARVDSRYMTVVLDRKIVPDIRMEFIRRIPPHVVASAQRR